MLSPNKMTYEEAEAQVQAADGRYHLHYQNCGCEVLGFDCERGQVLKGNRYLAERVLVLVSEGAFVSLDICGCCNAEEGHYGWCDALSPPKARHTSQGVYGGWHYAAEEVVGNA